MLDGTRSAPSCSSPPPARSRVGCGPFFFFLFSFTGGGGGGAAEPERGGETDQRIFKVMRDG